ncbi:translocation/assembly module TamB domain-containing protein [Glaesserella parasuis]|nr:translocation/assembly module TamB domain-containing protein [Glaesserella parasuis]
MEKEQSLAQSPNDTAVKPHNTKWRWLWRGLCVLLILLLLPLAFLATGMGQRTALTLADKWLDPLSISKVEGSLQNGLTLTDTAYQLNGVNVQVGQAELHLDLSCLLAYSACVEKIAIKDTQVAVDTSKLPPSTPNTQTSGEFNLPIGVSLKQISIDNLKVQVDELDIGLQHFQSGIQGKGKSLSLSPTQLQGLTVSLAPQQTTEKPQKVAETPSQPIDWEALKQQLAQPILTKLDSIQLPINLSVPEFQAKQLQLSQKVKTAKGISEKSLLKISLLELQAKSDEQSVELQKLNLQSDKGTISGIGKLTLSGNYPLDWKLNAQIPHLKELAIPASQADLILSGELFGIAKLDLKTSGAFKANIHGTVQFSEPKTPLDLSIKSPKFSYPFIAGKGKDPLVFEKIDLALKGDLLNYYLNGSLSAKGMNIPPADLSLKGQGELTYFAVNEALLNALQGQTKFSGKVDWTNGLEWQSNLALQNVNTKSIFPEWVALLSGEFRSQGFVGRGETGNEWAVVLDNVDLHGNLQQKHLQLKGTLTADHNTLLNIPEASLIYGENRIVMQGVLGEKSDFNATIKAPNLQGLIPHLKANINGQIKLQGNINEPSLDLDLIANNVAYDQFQLQHLNAKGKVSTAQQVQGDLEIGLRQLTYGEITLENANLTANASEANHSLKLTAKGKPVGIQLHLAGQFDRSKQQWQGELSNLNIHTPVGEWKNDKNLQVSYHNQELKADVSAHCWRNPKATLCLPQTFSAGKEGKVPFEIKQFNLEMLQEYLPKESILTGIVNAKGDVAWFSQKDLEVNVELLSNSLKFTQKLNGRSFPLSLSSLKLNGKIAENNLSLDSDVRIENNGRLTSKLLMKELTKQRGLSGNINIDQLNLRLIEPLLSTDEKVNGDINARLTLGGTALSPQLLGNLNLTGLQVHSKSMPFDVTGGMLALNFKGASSTLKGNIQTKESQLLLEGDANWQKLEAWHTRIKAQANRFRVDIPNIAKVDLSPHIEVKATPKELILGGNIDIPWARIAVEELPKSAVTISSDEVIMDGSAKNKNKATALLNKNLPQNNNGMAIKADVAINIGNDVKLDAYGLKTDLNGIIKVQQGNRGLGLYGQVHLKNGTFASFGQDLVIRKGLISFTGLSSQPTLDIEAIRNPEAMEDANVTAGVKVTGIADAPEVKIFSTPSMSQDQALSYILTGRGLDGGSDADSSNSVAAALIGMSLSKSSKTVGTVGSAFGINDLNVTTAGIGDNTKVVVSGSLTPKFKVKYGVGLFAPLTELTLRYRLAPSLYLQWVSSINQAVDLMYRYEFD